MRHFQIFASAGQYMLAAPSCETTPFSAAFEDKSRHACDEHWEQNNPSWQLQTFLMLLVYEAPLRPE
jgi:hypothetical protein